MIENADRPIAWASSLEPRWSNHPHEHLQHPRPKVAYAGVPIAASCHMGYKGGLSLSVLSAVSHRQVAVQGRGYKRRSPAWHAGLKLRSYPHQYQ